jgi:pilus assembly protein Flp/PilA
MTEQRTDLRDGCEGNETRILTHLWRDEDGASMVEYTVLIGLLTVATISVVLLVGSWVSGQWATLNAALPK